MTEMLLSALSNGGLYGLAALGIGLVFGVMRLVNFAHGELITCAAYVFFLCLPAGLFVAIVAAIAAAAVLTLIIQRGIFDRLRGAEPSVLLIASFGISTLLQRGYETIFGALPKSAQASAWLSGAWTIGGAQISRGQIITIILTLGLLVALKLTLDRTTIGLQIRAASSDFTTAQLLGVRASRVLTAAFVASGVLAGVVGFIVFTQRGQVDPEFGVNLMILALVGTVVGGLGSLQGAAVGGMLVGALLSVLNTVLGNDRTYSYSVLFALVIVVLLVRPAGLFGQGSFKERV